MSSRILTGALTRGCIVLPTIRVCRESDIINALVSAEAWLRPFAVAQRPRFANMTALAALGGRAVPSAQELASRITVMRTLAEHTPRLKQIFALGQSDGSLELLMRIVANAGTVRFVSRLAGLGGAAGGGPASALALDYLPAGAPVRQELGAELLAEVVRGAALSTPTEEQREDVDRVVAAYHAASAVHAERVRLEAMGHPEFSRGDAEYIDGGIDVSGGGIVE